MTTQANCFSNVLHPWRKMFLEHVFLCIFYSLMIAHIPIHCGCTGLQEKGKSSISPGIQFGQHLFINVKTELGINEYCSQQMEVHLKFSFSNTTWLTQHTADSLYTGDWTREFENPLWWILFFLSSVTAHPPISTSHQCHSLPFLIVTLIYWSLEHSLAFHGDGHLTHFILRTVSTPGPATWL